MCIYLNLNFRLIYEFNINCFFLVIFSYFRKEGTFTENNGDIYLDEKHLIKDKNSKSERNLKDLKQEYCVEISEYKLALNNKKINLNYILEVCEMANYFNKEDDEFYSLMENNYFVLNFKFLIIFIEDIPNLDLEEEKLAIQLHFKYILNKLIAEVSNY